MISLLNSKDKYKLYKLTTNFDVKDLYFEDGLVNLEIFDYCYTEKIPVKIIQFYFHLSDNKLKNLLTISEYTVKKGFLVIDESKSQ